MCLINIIYMDFINQIHKRFSVNAFNVQHGPGCFFSNRPPDNIILGKRRITMKRRVIQNLNLRLIFGW